MKCNIPKRFSELKINEKTYLKDCSAKTSHRDLLVFNNSIIKNIMRNNKMFDTSNK